MFANGKRYRRIIENLQPKCLNNACHRPRIPGDELGLCRKHRADLTHGKHRAYPDPRVREYSVEDANNVIDEFIEVRRLPEKISLRKLAKEMNTTKDLLYHVRRRTFPHVRSEAMETLSAALATALYESTILPR
jgi:hypothetical protein